MVDRSEEGASEPRQAPLRMEPHERGGERPGEGQQRAGDGPEDSTRLAKDEGDRRDKRRSEVERVSPGRTEAAGPVAERRLDQDRWPERPGDPQEGSAEPRQPEGKPGEDEQQGGVVRQEATRRVEGRRRDPSLLAEREDVEGRGNHV